MSYWTFQGTVGLRGVDGTLEVLDDCFGRAVYHPDPENPVIIYDDLLLYALRTSQRARDDFQRLFPILLPEEQERLSTLLELNPRISALVLDDQKFADQIQSKWNTGIPVRTSGKYGGTGRGPMVVKNYRGT